MNITKLRLNYFGKFTDREIELKPGINLIYGENEAGKSTIHTFIKGMLFGIERLRGRGAASKEDIYTKYLPWSYPGAYSGSMDIEVDGKSYRLSRSFHANDKSFMVTDLLTGREVNLKEGHISSLLPGLTEAAYRNTIGIEQLKAYTDAELAKQLQNYIANLSIAGSREVDVTQAVNILIEQRKAIEALQDKDALKNLKEEIKEGLDKEERMEELSKQLKTLLDKEQKLKEVIGTNTDMQEDKEAKYMEQLPAILEKYNNYKEFTKQAQIINQQLKELDNKREALEKEVFLADRLKKDLTEVNALNLDIVEYERNIEGLSRDKEKLQSRRKRNLLICITIVLTVALLAFVFSEDLLIGGIITGCSVAAGFIGQMFFNRRDAGSQRNLDNSINTQYMLVTETKNRLMEILQQYNISKAEELYLRHEEALTHDITLTHIKEQLDELIRRKSEIDDNHDALYDIIMNYIQHFMSEEELSEGSIQRLKEEVYKKRQEMIQQQSDKNNQLEAYRFQIEKIRWELEALEDNEGLLLANQQRYKELNKRYKDNEIELEAIKLALSSIKELSTDIHDSFGRQLNKEVSDTIGIVTKGKYTDLLVDEKLDVKVCHDKDYISLDRLSAGTMDQIYLALRLTVADMLLGRNEYPIILDDSFALYDDNRIKAAITLLADRKQLIMFSCHQREKRILKELGLPYHMVDLNS